jgi:hypothetical protein
MSLRGFPAALPLRPAATFLLAILIALALAASPARAAKPKTGSWSGTAVDDKYAVSGPLTFKIAKDGRELRNLRVDGMTADCVNGSTATDIPLVLRRAKIRPSGLMRGHHVSGDPGSSLLSIVSYDARFKRTNVLAGRLYDDKDIYNVGSTCDIPPMTFSASRD